MAKYCGKCGSRLDEATGLCPSCDAAKIKQQSENLKVSEASAQEQGHRAESKGLSEKENISPSHRTNKRGQKKAAKREKRANWSTGKKVRKFFMKLILTLLLLVVLAVGAMGALVYFDMINIPLLSTFNQNSFLKFVNEKNIIVEEKNVIMMSETEGTATIVVTLPNYKLLFESAVIAGNPDNYLLKALILGNYETQKFELSANVTVENGERVIHSDEIVHQLLEEYLVDAINALSEVRQ